MKRSFARPLSLIAAGMALLVADLAQAESSTNEVIGNRIPYQYIVTDGAGDTDIGPGDDPWETGSYDLALLEAQIANFNIVPYTSVLPPEADEISIEEAKPFYHHGAVMEVIMATVNGIKGDTLTTGVGRIWVRYKSTGKLIGGFAAEYEKVYKSQKVPEDQALAEAEKLLKESLLGEVERRYESGEVEAFGITYQTNYEFVDKKYGTSLTALGWLTYIYPAY